MRQTHDILRELIPLERLEIPSGTHVYDWTVPREWVVREAYLIAPDGRRILDIQESNLHVLNYSIPYSGTVSRAELDLHLFSLPEQPDAVPYVTSYYAPRWGFCLSDNQRQALSDGDYVVRIDTDHIDGSLTLGEAVLPGDEETEVLISTYTCHPQMASNELSGPLVAAFLYRQLAAHERRRLTYRFAFNAETIGTLCYLQLRGEPLRRHLLAGYVLTCIGDAGAFTYKRSRRGDTPGDRAAAQVLAQIASRPPVVLPFVPDTGSEERQYCSPGFNLPVGSLMRTMYGHYPEYHTSLDNRDYISFEAIAETVEVCAQVLAALEENVFYTRTMPFGEPQLGQRGLYPTLSQRDWQAERDAGADLSALMWLLNNADGEHDLLAIADLSGHSLRRLASVAARCISANLVVRSA